jgi:hypothetical protein
VFEEWGGDPNGISLVRRDVDSVCADIYEWQPTLMNYQMQASGKVNKPLRPKAHLSCGPGQKIRSIKFASFGTPEGVCGSYRQGSCHAFHSYDAFNNVCSLAFVLPSLFSSRKTSHFTSDSYENAVLQFVGNLNSRDLFLSTVQFFKFFFLSRKAVQTE